MATPTINQPEASGPEPSTVPRLNVPVTLTVSVDIARWIADGHGTEADTVLSLRRKVRDGIVEAVSASEQFRSGVVRVDGYR